MRILTMKCAGCAAPLQIRPDTTQFVCAYCGAGQIVDRSGGIVTLNLVAEAIEKVQQGTDRTAAELALIRLTKKLAKVEMEIGYCPMPPNLPRPPPERKGVSKAFHDAWIGRSTAALGKGMIADMNEWEARNLWRDYDDALTRWNNDESRRKQLMAEKSVIETELLFNEAIVKRRQ